MNLDEYIANNLVHSLHTSARRSFRSCRRRWNWVYREFLYPKVEAPPLEFGVAFHCAMETFYNPEQWNKPDHAIVGQAMALLSFKNKCTEQLKNYKRLNGDPELDKLREYDERIKLGLNMIRYYTDHVSPLYDHNIKPVRVEVPFEVPILSPEGEPLWCKCEQCFNKTESWLKSLNKWDSVDRRSWYGLPVTYGGRLDALVQDDIGRYWIVDFKTTSRILDEDAEASFLQLDDQLSSYLWALRQIGIPTSGFIYIEIKKAYPQPPEELTRSYKGRKYSTNKQFLTTHALFEKCVRENDLEAYITGLYDNHLAWLKAEGPKFHQRHQIHKNEHELDEIGKNIYLEAQDMINDPLIYPQPGRFSCTTCLFRQPCLGVNQGEDYQWTLDSLFEKRNKHYWEEKEPSTE